MNTAQISAQSTAARPRILFLGENWYGSCARACCYALRRLGCDVTDIDVQTVIPHWRRPSNRAIARVLRPRLIGEYNQLILDIAAQVQPDILFAFKGSYVQTRTLEVLVQSGVALYNYYPDTSPTAHDPYLAQSIRAYDCIFYTKKFWANALPDGLQGRRLFFVPHGYDPEIHRPLPLNEQDRARYGHDVTIVATHTAYKEQLLARLIRRLPELDLHIYGNGWRERVRSPELKPFIRGFAVCGSEYAKAVGASRICLAIMSGRVQGVMQGDETTTRTFEIPACGGFMLHERTPELRDFFEEGKEVACFGSPEELAEKVEYYLAYPAERDAIARAGHARCVPAYSYDNRVREILRYHESAAGIHSELAAVGN
jgi:glycosyltransferase involved in cell wall biosynthesis